MNHHFINIAIIVNIELIIINKLRYMIDKFVLLLFFLYRNLYFKKKLIENISKNIGKM